MMKILFITCSRIGDAVLTTGILQYIINHYPNARVTIAVDPLPAPLFSDYPLLDNLIVFPKQKRGRHWLSLWQQVRGQRWDWVIDLRGSLIGYAVRSKRRAIWRQRAQDNRHKAEQISGLVGIQTTPPALWFSSLRLKYAYTLLPQAGHYLAMAPAANWIGKQWPISYFIELAQKFSHHHPGAKVVVMAAPHERPMVQPLLQALPASSLICLMDYNLDLGQIAACLSRCHLFIGNDSGLMHMAAAVGVPTIGLFGPSREENYGPYDSHYDKTGMSVNRVIRIPKTYQELKNTPGFSHKTKDCYMTDLKVDTVWPVLQEQWQRFVQEKRLA